MRYQLIAPTLCLVAVILSGSGVALAQTSQITGRITDTSHGTIRGANITATHVDRGVKRVTTSNEEGYYTVPLLQPGNYEVTVEMSGFKPITQSGITLRVQEVARLDFTLEVGEVAERVSVIAEAPLLERETSSLGKVIDARRIEKLPLLGRNPYSLVALVPGARPSIGLNDLPVDQISTFAVSINGARANQNEYLLDGAPNTAAAQNQPVIFANPDAVQEFKVETNSYSAQYGRAAGGIFNIVTKSGTNELHGTLYDYLRNDALNANNFFSNRAGIRKAPFQFNQFGATLGGPIVVPGYNGRERSFFFVSYEGVRFSQGGTYVGTVPTLLQREGNFSETRDSQGRLIQIFDPATTRPNPANPAQFIRDPFSGNVVPRDRWNPVAVKLLDFIPLPNAAGNAVTGAGNYVTSAVNRIRKDTFSVRLDHHLTPAQHLAGRFNYDDTPLNRADVYGSLASPTFGPQVFKRRNLGLTYTVTFSPVMVGSFLISFTRLENNRLPRSFGFDITQLGLPAALKSQLFPESFPAITVTGMGGASSLPNTGTGALLGGSDLITFGDNTASWVGSLTRSFSRHTLKFGGEARLLRPNYRQFSDQAIQFSFTQAFTQGPNAGVASPTAGVGFASLLLGVAGGSYTRVPALAMQHIYWGGFVQDDWKLTNKLTLNVGVRYEYETPRTDRFNQLTNFDPHLTPPLVAPGLNLQGALAFVGVNGRARGQWDPDRNNFAPRVGLAYQLTPKTVVRAGFGVFYAAMTGVGGGSGAFGVAGFEAATSVVTSLDGVRPVTFLDHPYPTGVNQPTGSSLGPATLLGQSIRFTARDARTSNSKQWNLNVQRELPGHVLFEVGYAGNRGLKLQNDLELNQLPDSALALGDALRQQVPNPFFGQITTGALSARTVARAQLLRPYAHLQSITAVNATFASSNYHGLVVSGSRRFNQGLTMMASYTFSKLIDQATGAFAGEPLSTAGFQNFNNLRAERSRSSLDAPHRFVVNGVYALPFGADQRFRPTGVLGVIANGWELSGILTFQSGGPLAITSASNTTFSQGGGQRPNLTGQQLRLADGERSIARWFNTAAFSAPPPFTFGNAPRTLGSIRSDGIANADLSLVRTTKLAGRTALQFRSELFNLLNTPRFAPPNTSFGSPAFGQVNNQANQPRVIQFALKVVF
jgi:outer membrane receptor protein involved in Fe transport